MSATIWSVLPPIVAIALALITKEVYSSLLVGIVMGGFLYAGFLPVSAVETSFDIMTGKIGDNAYILIFLVLLGILVALITKSGASKAYGNWASKSIKSNRGALAATSLLGTLIFVDDYFNCLTVGTVMRPVTDRYKISRQKLAYIIDATAAPVCILSPISSWAAAVSTSLPKGSKIDGFSLFLKTIPLNMYAIFTLIFLIFMIWLDEDFFRMREYEKKVGQEILMEDQESDVKVVGNGKVIDLILPILVLIASAITAMLYTGGLFSGKSVIKAFADCESAKGLVIGCFFTLVFTFLLYIPRKVVNYEQFCESFIQGFKSMTPAIMILCLAWTLSGICSADYLNIGGFVGTVVKNNDMITMLLPVMLFVIALGLSFATGTSWGTFGILIPIAVSIISDSNSMLVLSVAAILAGAVCGDHISPISDTTILASAGAQCKHIEHVSTQLPYALLVALPCGIGYFIAGILKNSWVGLGVGLVVLIAIMIGIVIIVHRDDARDASKKHC